jgi:hypothetical protein
MRSTSPARWADDGVATAIGLGAGGAAGRAVEGFVDGLGTATGLTGGGRALAWRSVAASSSSSSSSV